jgi:ribonuclease P protein component
MRRSLTKRERLGRGSDLERLFAEGRKTSCRGSRLVSRRNELEWSRMAVVTARGYRRAVDRNREKRLIRESYRNLKDLLLPGFDVAFVLYPGSFAPTERREQFRELMSRSGVLREPRGIDG